MTSKEKFINELTKIRQKEFNRKRICMVEGCEENCIKSHLLQRKGILNQIAEKNHIYILEEMDLYKFSINTPPQLFRKVGIKAGMTLPLFCNKHDSEIFEPIEQHEYDTQDYQIQLIFAYRSICAELRKKQIQSDIFGAKINNQIIRTERPPEELNVFTTFLIGLQYGIKGLTFYKKELEKDMAKDVKSPRFTFQTSINELVDVCTTATFSPIDYATTTNPKQEKPLNAVMINVFPKSDKTHVIVGYHNGYKSKWIEDYFNSWKSHSKSDFQKKYQHY